MAPAFALQPVRFDDLPGWAEDDPRPVIRAMRRCHAHVTGVKPYRTGALGVTSAELLPALDAARSFDLDASAEVARRFFEAAFVPFRVTLPDGKTGFVTAFYEPEVPVAGRPDDEFRYAFYRRPADLVDVEGQDRPPGLDPAFAFARRVGDSLTAYPDRRAIDEGFLEGRGLEIAWARSKVDVFFAHVQGAARLVFPDGTIRRVTYAAKTGHPFSAIGRLLIDEGRIDPETVSMATIRAYLADHPGDVDRVLWHNRSYIFFREAEVDDAGLGPVAAAKVALEPGRSLAVDRLIHTFGTPFFVRSDTLTHMDGGRPFRRLMLALDTGSAIVGPARGDIFTGSGDAAGRLAGGVRNAADVVVLIPRAAAERYGGHGTQ
ncbi:murein transglycosylase A [Ensifer soli]|uniref:murein transglycosylase A n=1 Tax=Ciceribacter sp. sgz301302 TaxID=3342379 RepID=UPI0035BA2D58